MSLVQWNPSHGYPHKLGSTVLHKNKILEVQRIVMMKMRTRHNDILTLIGKTAGSCC